MEGFFLSDNDGHHFIIDTIELLLCRAATSQDFPIMLTKPQMLCYIFKGQQRLPTLTYAFSLLLGQHLGKLYQQYHQQKNQTFSAKNNMAGTQCQSLV